MAHPYKDHKQSHNGHDRARAKHLLKGYKRGGAVKGEDGDKSALKAAKKIVKHEEDELKVEGKKHGGRLDKYARGGRTKGKKPHTQVNIAVVSGHGKDDHASAAPAGGPPSPGGASAAPPPPPAGMPPPGMMPPGMMPPGMMGRPPMPPPGAMPPGGKPPGMMKRGGRTKVIKKAFGGPLGGAPGMQPPAVGMPAGMANFPHMPQGSQQLPPSQNYTDAMQALQQRGPDVQQQGGRFAGHPMMRPPGDPATATLNPMAQQALGRMQAGQSPFMPFPQAPQAPIGVPQGTQTGAFKRGGRTKGKMTAGMESGVGRLEASKNARKRG